MTNDSIGQIGVGWKKNSPEVEPHALVLIHSPLVGP